MCDKLSAAKAEMAAVNADTVRYEPAAPFSGVLRDLSPDLRPGVWLSAREPLARLIADQGELAVASVDEDDVSRIAAGDSAKFYADNPGGPVIPLEVVGIDSDASRVLPEPELPRSSAAVSSPARSMEFYPERPVYRVTLKPMTSDDTASRHTWRGEVVISGRWMPPGLRDARSAMGLFRREAGF